MEFLHGSNKLTPLCQVFAPYATDECEIGLLKLQRLKSKDAKQEKRLAGTGERRLVLTGLMRESENRLMRVR